MGTSWGDKVLVSIVDIIQQSIRPDDILARLEGEVFGLLFTELNSARKNHCGTYA